MQSEHFILLLCFSIRFIEANVLYWFSHSFCKHFNFFDKVICFWVYTHGYCGFGFGLDCVRSVFSNNYSRKLPKWGTVNEKIAWSDLKKPLIANILALNAFAHHDMIVLPMAENQTVTTETIDVAEDITARVGWFPLLGSALDKVIKGFHGLVFGKSPSGFKSGG